MAQPPTVYLARAAEACRAGQPGDQRATAVRYPEHEGYPVRASSRARMSASSPARGPAPHRLFDPPTGKVLDVVDVRSTLFGFLHVFHENLDDPATQWTPDRRLGRRRHADPVAQRHLPCGRVTTPSAARCGAAARRAHQSAQHARFLDRRAAGRRVADRHVSRVSRRLRAR